MNVFFVIFIFNGLALSLLAGYCYLDLLQELQSSGVSDVIVTVFLSVVEFLAVD
jgi:hypothetical protein